MTEHGPFLIRRLFARLDFLLTSYYGVTRCFVITRMVYMVNRRHIYTGAVISSNSMGLQNSASRLAKPTSRSMMAGIMYLKNLVIYLIFFGCFDFMYADIIFRLTVQPRWHLKIFYCRKYFGKFITQRKSKWQRLCTKAYQHQKYQLAYYKATRCPQ